MKIKTADAISTLVGKVVKFNKGVEEFEIDFDKGMLARVKSIVSAYDIYSIRLDFKEFQQYNENLMLPNFYDKNGIPCEKWSEQNRYDKDLNNGTEVFIEFEQENGELYELPFDLYDNGKRMTIRIQQGLSQQDLILPEDDANILMELLKRNNIWFADVTK